MNYNSIDDAMNTIENMTVILDNKKTDEGKFTLDGLPGFMFNNRETTSVVINANSYFGFGGDYEHISLCYRDGAVYSIYREEATLYNTYHFVKYRWDGYSNYRSNGDAKLIYELFIFDTGHIFINAITIPTNASYLGSSRIVAGITTNFDIQKGTPVMLTLKRKDEAGINWSVVYEKIDIPIPLDKRILVESGGKIYSYLDQVVEEVPVSQLDAAAFKTYGMDYVKDLSMFTTLINPKLYYWQDTDAPLGKPNFHYQAKAKPQILLSKIFDVSSIDVIGIDKVEVEASENVKFSISTDNGESYYKYANGWIPATDEYDGMLATTFTNMEQDDLNYLVSTNCYRVKIVLEYGEFINKLLITYKKGGDV